MRRAACQARIVGQHLQERIGQSVVIENRASGGAVLAVGALMVAPADGYTFLVTDGGILSTNPALFKQLSYNPKDIIPLALLGRGNQGFPLADFAMWRVVMLNHNRRPHNTNAADVVADIRGHVCTRALKDFRQKARHRAERKGACL